MEDASLDPNAPQRQRVAPVVLAFFIPCSGYFALGR
jgi:hypothetical protein